MITRTVQADLELARAAIAAAGEAVMRWFGSALEVTHKAPDQPLTEADLEADRILRERLLAETPDYGWLSEESADRPDRLERERVWIVDPIDGTRSFIRRRPEFAISVGLVERGRAVLGVVSNPASCELYWAVLGRGAFGRDPGGMERRLHVRPESASRSLLASRTELAAGEFEPFRDAWELLPVGSTAYKLARVAAGDGSAFISRGAKSEWDVCAGALLVQEAGGVVTDLDGRALAYNRADPYVHGIAAGERAAHAAVLALCRALPPSGRLDRDRRALPEEED